MVAVIGIIIKTGRKAGLKIPNIEKKNHSDFRFSWVAALQIPMSLRSKFQNPITKLQRAGLRPVSRLGSLRYVRAA
jgi:hypothetical protein